MDVEKYFSELHASGKESLEKSTADAEIKAGLGGCLQNCLDWRSWSSAIQTLGQDALVVDWAAKELQLGAYMAASGHYRSAFSQIRLFLELSLSFVEFSIDELARRKWMVGERDIKWSLLMDEKNGCLSKELVLIFFKELAGEMDVYKALANSAYRDCSAFVHGEAETHRIIEHKVEFNRALMIRWIELSESAHQSALYWYVVRYLREFKPEAKAKIVVCVNTKLGHLTQVRDLL